MKRYICFCIIFALLLLVGCKREDGVYFEAVSGNIVGESYSEGLHLYATLSHEGRVYTAQNIHTSGQQEDRPVAEAQLTKLASVYCNEKVYWSSDRNALSEATGTGTLYTVSGYDPDFLLFVEFAWDADNGSTYYDWYAFTCVNDIRLNTGSDLFAEKYSLSDMDVDTVWDNAAEKYCDVASLEGELPAFLNALNSGVFLNPESEDTPSLALDEGYDITFFDALGLSLCLTVCEDGTVFVRNPGQNTMALSVDAAACETFLAAIDSE